ncbi:hypothetical protein M9435_003717 [Picochlorum sp. BPE23]|nr:hypothetical protein M9435_003717 [Picochlorum sp. BPE23]
MATPSPVKIPPGIAKASKEELEKLLVNALHKIKARDRTIAELEGQSDTSGVEQRSGDDSKVEELENTVQGLQERLVDGEKKYQERLQAETEVLLKGFAEERERLRDGFEAERRKEHEKIVKLEADHDRQAAEIERLTGLVERSEQVQMDAENEIGEEKQQLLKEIGDLKAQNESLMSRLDEMGKDVERRVETGDEAVRSLEKALSESKSDVGVEKEKNELAEKEIQSLKDELEKMKGEQSKRISEEIAGLKKELDDAKLELENKPAPQVPAKIEFDESSFVKIEDYKAVQKEMGDMKKKFAQSLKKKQAESESTIEELKKELEAAKTDGSGKGSSTGEVAQIRKEVEVERSRFKRALGELKRRNESLSKSKIDLEKQVSDLEVQIESLKAEGAAAARQAQEARSLAEQSSNAFKEYKARAHSLLKAKEDEIKEGRSTAKEEYEKQIEEATAEKIQAETRLKDVVEELEKLKSENLEHVYSVEQKYEGKIADMEKELKNAKECSKASNRQYEQLRVRLESYDDRFQSLKRQLEESKQELLAAKSHHPGSSISEGDYESLKAALSRSEKEKLALEEVKVVMEGEIADLKAMIKQLKMTLAMKTSLPKPEIDVDLLHHRPGSADFVVSPKVSGSQSATASVAADDLENLHQQLAAANRKASIAEQEVDDLEKEVELRNTQEKALKETVRELERELERVKLTSKGVDMEYFKNILLKLFETGEEESLLPVIGTMLKFSPAELDRCRKALATRREQHADLLQGAGEASANVTSYLTDLLGFGTTTSEA